MASTRCSESYAGWSERTDRSRPEPIGRRRPDMPDAVEALTSLLRERDPCAHPTEELRQAQLEAIAESFQQRREQIRVLDRRARDVDIEKIQSFDDVVPLLFAHTNYK